MDGERFDALARQMTRRISRRRAARLAGFGTIAALFGHLTGVRRADAGHCTTEPCACTRTHQCGDGMICCIPGQEDGWDTGVCRTPDSCNCAWEGCVCYTLQRTPCAPGLSCEVVVGPSVGYCLRPSEDSGGCTPWGQWCPSSCGWGRTCDGCCSGFCGGDGACSEQICDFANCRCDPTDPFSCLSGLTCTPVQAPLGSDLPGGVCL
jgi:hypothetical protein